MTPLSARIALPEFSKPKCQEEIDCIAVENWIAGKDEERWTMRNAWHAARCWWRLGMGIMDGRSVRSE